MSNDKKNKWIQLFEDIFQRASTALSTPSFILTFLFIIIGVGSIGVWLPPIWDPKINWIRPDAFFTYSFPILMTVTADIILRDSESKDFNMLCLVFAIVAGLSTCYGVIKDHNITSIVGFILVLLVWFFVNANDDKYSPPGAANSPSGGKLETASQLAGEGV